MNGPSLPHDSTVSHNFELNDGAHILYTYGNHDIYLLNALSFISAGLRLKQGVIFVDYAENLALLLQRLKEAGFSKQQLDSIVFANSTEFYNVSSTSMSKMVNKLQNLTRKFVSKKTPIRTWGNVTEGTAINNSNNLAPFVKYEQEVNSLLCGSEFISVCAYDGDNLTANMLLELLKYHNLCMTDEELLDSLFHAGNTRPSIFLQNSLTEMVYTLQASHATLTKKMDERTQLLASIVETSHDAVTSETLEGIILSWNKAAERIYGYTAKEAIGRHVSFLAPPSLQEDGRKILESIKQGKRIHRYETQRVRKDGQLITVALSASPIKNKHGDIIAVSAIIRDITQMKKYESEIARFERLNVISEMAASIGHEVRNPLTTIRGFLQLLEIKTEYRQHKHFFKLMIDELDRACDIITEFLSISKNVQEEFKLTDIDVVVNTLVPLLQADALANGCYLEVELCGSLPKVAVDTRQIRQLILNLVRNAIDAMSNGGKVLIKTYAQDEQVVLAVKDAGCGIPPEILSSIGKPFFTTKENGTGLGLSTCYNICKRHQAVIDIDTNSQGTTFNVKFGSEKKQS